MKSSVEGPSLVAIGRYPLHNREQFHNFSMMLWSLMCLRSLVNGLAWLRVIEEKHFVGVPNLQVELSSILINAGMLIVIH